MPCKKDYSASHNVIIRRSTPSSGGSIILSFATAFCLCALTVFTEILRICDISAFFLPERLIIIIFLQTGGRSNIEWYNIPSVSASKMPANSSSVRDSLFRIWFLSAFCDTATLFFRPEIRF